MDAILSWILTHYDEVLAAVGYLYRAASVIVGLTPTKRDDAFLARLSFLAPANARGTFKLPGARVEIDQ
jgi:hypothetical protein